ncbi:MAG: substrate-binding domain-containing protein [Pseudomonadota bacterium]
MLFFSSTSLFLSAQDRFIVLASTTSTDNSGLFAHLLPRFTADTGIDVRMVARGTGQAIKMAEAGDADVLLVHHRPSEEAFVAAGFGVARHDLMYNDFVLIGPRNDPAGVRAIDNAGQAFARILEDNALFVSRGDDSGTHKKELAIWAEADLDPVSHSGTWYRETGSGMGASLNAAAAMGAYILADRATWMAFRNKGDLELLFEGDPSLFNPYGVILVSPVRHPHVRASDGQAFIDWLLSPTGQDTIADFAIDGQQLFFPYADQS